MAEVILFLSLRLDGGLSHPYLFYYILVFSFCQILTA